MWWEDKSLEEEATPCGSGKLTVVLAIDTERFQDLAPRLLSPGTTRNVVQRIPSCYNLNKNVKINETSATS